MSRFLRALFAAVLLLPICPHATAQIVLTQDAGCFSPGVFDPAGTCADVFLLDPATGTHQAAAHTADPLSHTGPLSITNTDIITFNPPLNQFDPNGGIDAALGFQDNFIELTVFGSQSVFPGQAPDGTSEAAAGLQLNQTIRLDDTSGISLVNTQWDVDISGSMTFPSVPTSPSGISLGINISVMSTVNGNPVQTPIFSANLSLDEDDTGIQITGNSAGSFTFDDDFSNPDVVVRNYSATGSIFPNVSLPNGQEFQILGFVLGSINSQASTDANAALVNDFSDTIQITVTAPDTTTFTQIPEPGSAALLAVALPLLARRRR